jgi:hypothetical protein
MISKILTPSYIVPTRSQMSLVVGLTESSGGLVKSFHQGRIKGFVGPRHFSSLGRFGDSTNIVGTTAYSRLSGLMEGEGMHG